MGWGAYLWGLGGQTVGRSHAAGPRMAWELPAVTCRGIFFHRLAVTTPFCDASICREMVVEDPSSSVTSFSSTKRRKRCFMDMGRTFRPYRRVVCQTHTLAFH